MNKKFNILNKYSTKLFIGLLFIFMSGFFISSVNASVPTTGMLTSPNGGEQLSGTQTITWKTSYCETGDKVNLTLGYNGTIVATPGSTKTIDSGLNCSSGSYSAWNTDDSIIGDRDDFVVGIERVNSSGVIKNTDNSDNFFTIDNTAPTFTVGNGTEPGPVQTDTINITVDASISGLVSSNYGFSSTDNSCDVADYASGDADPFTSGDDFTISGDHTDYLCVKAVDNAGNTGYYQVGKLNTDNTAPTATVVGATVQSTGDTIKITFSEDVTPADANWADKSEFNFESPVGSPIDTTNATFVFVTATNVLTVTLDETTDTEWLKNGDTVKVIPTSGTVIQDTAGNFLSSTPILSIAVTGDITQPTVALTYNPDREVRDADTVIITATFNELVEPGADSPVISIDTTDIDVAPITMLSTGDPLVWTYSWDVPAGSDGTATITIDAEDYAGNTNATATNNERTIDNIAPTVGSSYLLDDNTADAFFNSTTDNVKIEITADEPVKYTRIYICEESDAVCDNGTATKWFTSISSYITDVTKQWDGNNTVPAQALDGEYKVKINFEDEAGNTSTETLTPYNIFVDTVTPNITDFDDPDMGTVYRTDPPVDFTPSDVGGLGTLICSYSVDGGADTLVACTDGLAVNTNLTGLTDGRHDVDITVTDQAGNTITSSLISFVYDDDSILTVAKTGTPDFSTIQGAIDAWVFGITTIQVTAGNYPENVNVDQVLKIIGPNEGIDPNTGSRVGEATISGPSTGNVITVVSNNVTIDGFTITNGGVSSGTGIYSADYSNLTIQNNIITNIGNSGDDIVGRGIIVVSSASAVDNASILNNKINDITSGLRTGSGSTSASGISIGWSTGAEDITNLLIQDNVISDIDADTSPWSTTKGQGAYGVLLNHGTGGGKTIGAQITNNTISDLEGLWAHGIGLEGDTPNAVVTDNTISDITDHKGNTDGFGVFFQDNPSAASVTVTGNQFNGLKAEFGGVGIHLDDLSTYGYTVNAEDNWWGNTTGPFDGPLAGNKNPDGYGAYVTKNVDYSPFYNSAAMNTLVSVDPITSFDLNFDPTTQAVNNPSTLTVTAKDADGYTVVNDTTTQIFMTADNGASFGVTPITMGALGATQTTITNTIVGLVNVTATKVGDTSVYGIGTIIFIAGSDVTAPIISNIQVTSIGTDTATVTWDTDENSTSQVNFGVNPSYSSGTLTSVDATMVTTHSVTLTGLTSGIDYYFWVISADASPNIGTSEYNTFTTIGVDNVPPVITLLGDNPLTLTVGDTYTDAGATANDNIDGDITTDITVGGDTVNTSIAGTYIVTYNVSDTAGNGAVETPRTVIVVDPAVPPITPTVELNGATILSSYTVSEAEARFADGLEFNTTNVESFTINGSSVVVPPPIVTAKTKVEATAIGIHVYNVVVTSSTGDTANITVSYEVTADFDDTASLAVTGISVIANENGSVGYASANDDFADGWRWKYYITVPTDETQFQMKFSDFISGSNTILATNNVRFYTTQASANADQANAITILNADDPYSTAITLDDDLESGIAGRQIEVIVEMKVPVGSAGGSYSGSYGVQSN